MLFFYAATIRGLMHLSSRSLSIAVILLGFRHVILGATVFNVLPLAIVALVPSLLGLIE
jgi:hypothetical protein